MDRIGNVEVGRAHCHCSWLKAYCYAFKSVGTSTSSGRLQSHAAPDGERKEDAQHNLVLRTARCTFDSTSVGGN